MASDLEISGEHLSATHRGGFQHGYTPITREAEPGLDVGLDFGIRVLQGGERLDWTSRLASASDPGRQSGEPGAGALAGLKESAWILLEGRATVGVDGREFAVERRSLFDEAATVVHLPAEARLHVLAESARVEWAVAAAANTRSFAPRLFRPGDIEPEYRGLGLAQGTCLRNVRLVFDRRSRPESNLVVGEVVNYPGRWSSYPPHHHPQPEIYHYRFSEPQGYGHGEVGERVYKVRQYDTLRIPAGHDHAQVAAPGYAMYYLWVVRHLEGRPYEGFEFTPDHAWMLDPGARIWEPMQTERREAVS
jgi:5-deoxy-glucuronate isomerase